MLVPSGFHLDDPAWALIQAHISYWGRTSAAGNAGGTTVICAGLVNEPSYDGLIIKILDGPSAGQARPIQVQAGNTATVGVAFTNAAGAAQQITAGLRFVIMTSMAGGGGPGPSPEESLTYYGVVDAVPGANQFTIGALAALGAGKFAGATNPYQAFVLRDAGGASAAPQGELQPITAYTTGTGNFTTGAFTAPVAVGDEILIIHPSLASLLTGSSIVASGTLDTSSATVPADSTRTEANNFFRGHLLMPTAGAMRFRATRIVAYTGVGGIFTVDPNNPFPAVTGLVQYVVIRDQAEFVPTADGTNNRTPSDVLGAKDDTTVQAIAATTSVMRYLKGVVNGLFTTGGTGGIAAWGARALTAANIAINQVLRYIVEVKPEFSTPVSATHNTASADPTEDTVFTTAALGPGILHANFDINALVAGDDITFRVYKRVDGANYRLHSEQQFVGVPTLKTYSIDEFVDATMHIQVRTLRTSPTNRAFPYRYSIYQQPVV